MVYWGIITIFLCLHVLPNIVFATNIQLKGVGPAGSTFKTASTWPNYQIAAFVDVNADRQMDVILLDPEGSELFVSIAPSSQSYFALGALSKSSINLPSPISLLAPSLPEPIRSVVPADFNGDSVTDLLLLTSASLRGPFKAYIAIGGTGARRGQFALASRTPMTTFTSQPLVCDLNADSVADIFGQVNSSARLVITGGPQLTNESLQYTGPQWSALGYSAFGDINGDTVPDILLLVEQAGEWAIQLIRRDTSGPFGFARTSVIDLPDTLRSAPHPTLGLFVLADFDFDGDIDLLLPACVSQDCHVSEVFMYDFKKEAVS